MADAQRASDMARRLPEDEGEQWRVSSYRTESMPSVLQAAGFNAISVYHHWGLSEGKQGSLDFEYYRSHTDVYEAAKEVGLLVMSRPGVSRASLPTHGPTCP